MGFCRPLLSSARWRTWLKKKVSLPVSYGRKAGFEAKSCHACVFIQHPNFTWKLHLGKHRLGSQQHWSGASSLLNLSWQVEEGRFLRSKPHFSEITDMTALWWLKWWLNPIMPWKCHSLRPTNFNFVLCSQMHDVAGSHISAVKSKQCHYLLADNEKEMNRGWNMKCHYRKLVGY